MRIGHRIYFDGWAKTRPAVIASGAGCGWNLRTVIDRVGIKSRNVCRPSQRRVEGATADRFVVDARAQAAALRWYPGLAIVISKGGLTRRRSQRSVSGERATCVAIGESDRAVVAERRGRLRP